MGFINKFMTGGYHLVEARFYRSYYTNTHTSLTISKDAIYHIPYNGDITW